MRTENRIAGILVFMLLGSCATRLPENSDNPISGQRYVLAGNSFHWFIGPERNWRTGEVLSQGPLAALARERGRTGHLAVAVQLIGGSTPMDHWLQGGDDESQNLAKSALRGGGVDVLTLSPLWIMPERGVELFADLMMQTNPSGRLLVQHSWTPWDGDTRGDRIEGVNVPSFSNDDHDAADIAQIHRWLSALERRDGYLDRMRRQLGRVNRRAGRQLAGIVPVGVALYTLRSEILKGNVPGMTRQSELFRDGLGHPTRPGINLAAYVWYAVMYRDSPVGLQSLMVTDDPVSAERERLLQTIAWQTVLREPMSGVSRRPSPATQ